MMKLAQLSRVSLLIKQSLVIVAHVRYAEFDKCTFEESARGRPAHGGGNHTVSSVTTATEVHKGRSDTHRWSFALLIVIALAEASF